MSALAQHPLSSAFPSLSDSDFRALVRDIEANGLINPITTLDGAIVDGWHRYRACIELGVEPHLVELSESVDPVCFVNSMNTLRRHLTASQRAAAIVALAKWRDSGRPGKGGTGAGLSTSQMAESQRVSERTIRHAKSAQAAGLGEEVRDGKVSAKRAAEIAKLPVEERPAALLVKSETKPGNEPEEDTARLDGGEDVHDRLADLAHELEALTAIVEADDQLKAAAELLRKEQSAHRQTRQLYDTQRLELAAITNEAKRWRKKFEALEKKAGAK